ncbi:MAG: filamentous hemagglutinin N-terminal domain-containing protein, partial [Synechococcales bacterium]|nr:filamentous hemagglutinin N-terminal domain-containing protein [Synechococcales bacterium]
RSLLYLGMLGFTLGGIGSVQAQQVVPDGTINTQVTRSLNDFTITGGGRSGGNLFHSFSEFSVPTGGAAIFNNALDVQNIFARVTGASVSNIDGRLSAAGNANLFLLNPNGILFGPKASLNLGGSFVGTTAQAIQFSDGMQFSATHPTNPPLLTMSVPVGLQMGQNPGAIAVQGNGHQLRSTNVELGSINRSANTGGLRVATGQTLALVGGDINLQGGMLIAGGGRVELGSVKQVGTVKLTTAPTGLILDDANLNHFGNIQLSQKSLLDVSGSPAGSIQVQGHQVSLKNASLLLAQNQGAQAGGRIHVDAKDTLTIDGYLASQTIRSGLFTETLGDGASQDTTVNARQLTILNGAGIVNRTFGKGQGGNLLIQVSDAVVVRDLHPASFSGISSTTVGDGNGGNVTVSTSKLTVANGAAIGSVTYSQTKGRGGDLTINADQIEVIGNNLASSTALSTASLISGDAGSAIINTRTLMVRDSGVVTSSSSSRGAAGNITINASESVTVQGQMTGASGPSQIRSAVNAPTRFGQTFFGIPAVPVGKGGNVSINTPSLVINHQGLVTVRNQGIGDAGKITINAKSLRLDNGGSISATTNSGEGGNINLATETLVLRHGSTILSNAGRIGNGGNININAPILLGLENSDIIANAGLGHGGNITITTQGLIGLAFHNTLTPRTDLTNDITASSEFAINGEVTINNIETDPNSSLTELPTDLGDASQKVSDRCSAKQGSSFVMTGRGGILVDPAQAITRAASWIDLRSLPANFESGAKSAPVEKAGLPAAAHSQAVLVEATRLHRDAQGTIALLNHAQTVALGTPIPLGCHPAPLNARFTSPKVSLAQ